MIELQDPTQLTAEALRAADANERVQLLEDYLLASIRALRADAATEVEASSRLADLGIDSIQVVELKFGLDQLLGRELDIEIIINNPSIRELAVNSLRHGGL